jgi:hypothetical protein
VCGTIAGGDDYEDIVDWGKAHLSFLRGFAEFHHGSPCADWLRTVMNRINPELFMACISSWVVECWPDKLDLVASEATGPSKTTFTGASTSPSMRTNHASGPVTAPRIWPEAKAPPFCPHLIALSNRHWRGSFGYMGGTERVRSVACFPLGSSFTEQKSRRNRRGFPRLTRYETPRSSSERADRTSQGLQVNAACGGLLCEIAVGGYNAGE